MKIDYVKILFNYLNLKYIAFVFLFIFGFYFSVVISFATLFDYFSFRINNKYSYSIAIEYFKGIVNNPYAFYKTSLLYRNEKKFDKEKIELLYCKHLLEIYNQKDISLYTEISLRIKEIDNLY